MNINLRSKFYSYKYAQLSSIGFLILSIFLTDYTILIRLCLILQSGFSCYIWTYPEKKTMIYLDGTLAVINCIVLYNNHCKICDNNEMLTTLGKTVTFKIIDGFHSTPTNKVTLWYIYWHMNLILNNLYIAKWCKTLPYCVYIFEIATIQLLNQ